MGYEGPVCQTPVCYPGCQNGFCNFPWECICTGGYTGMLCDICPAGVTGPQCTQPLLAQPSGGPFQPAGGPFYHPQVDTYVKNDYNDKSDTGKYFHIQNYNISVFFCIPSFLYSLTAVDTL